MLFDYIGLPIGGIQAENSSSNLWLLKLKINCLIGNVNCCLLLTMCHKICNFCSISMFSIFLQRVEECVQRTHKSKKKNCGNSKMELETS